MAEIYIGSGAIDRNATSPAGYTVLDPNNPANWKQRSYHVDFWLEVQKGTKEQPLIEKWFVEIKPSDQVNRPVPPPDNASPKITKKFNEAAKTYKTNVEKWRAMQEYARRTNCKFYVFTEHTLRAIIGNFFAG